MTVLDLTDEGRAQFAAEWKKEKEDRAALMQSLKSQFGLGVRAVNALIYCGCDVSKPEAIRAWVVANRFALLNTPNLGPKSIREIDEAFGIPARKTGPAAHKATHAAIAKWRNGELTADQAMQEIASLYGF